MFTAPFVGLVGALIALIFFYAINASDSTDSLLSWSCRWNILNMTQRPNFGTLCRESWTGVYLSILLIPVEAVVLAVAGWQLKAESNASVYSRARKSNSPIMG